MSRLEGWKKTIKENALRDKDEIEEWMQSMVKSSEPFRLEILEGADDEVILIQGNLAGLESLANTLNRLVTTATIGGHAHLEEGHGLSRANVSVIIQLVGDGEASDGPHRVSWLDRSG